MFREVVKDFDNAADIVGAVPKDVMISRKMDGFVGALSRVGGFFHEFWMADEASSRERLSDIEQKFCGVGHALNGRNHLFDGSGCFATLEACT